MTVFEAARQLAERGGTGRVADRAALEELNRDLNGRIPAWYIELLTTVPLCGLEFIHEKRKCEILDVKGIRVETLETNLHELMEKRGFYAIGFDDYYYDPYCLGPGDDPEVHLINHDSEEVGCASLKLSTFFRELRLKGEPEPPPPPPNSLEIYAGTQVASWFGADEKPGSRMVRELGIRYPHVRAKDWFGPREFQVWLGERPASPVLEGELPQVAAALSTLREQRGPELTEYPPAGFELVLAPGFPAELADWLERARRSVSSELWLHLNAPTVTVREELPAGTYLLAHGGLFRGGGKVHFDRLLAAGGRLEGPSHHDFVFDRPVRWIEPEREAEAKAAGCAVFTPLGLVGALLMDVLRLRAPHFLAYEVAVRLIGKDPPLPYARVHTILQGLLADGVSLREMPRILAALKGPSAHDDRGEDVRAALAPDILKARFNEGPVYVFELPPEASKWLERSVVAPKYQQEVMRIVRSTREALLTTPRARPNLAKLLKDAGVRRLALSTDEVKGRTVKRV